MNKPFQSFAIVPAAGRSMRMGRPKLRLPWRDHTVIEQVLLAWRQSGVSSTVVVCRPDDLQLAELARLSQAEVVVPAIAPPEMKDSIRIALDHLEGWLRPNAQDVWLLAPADMPWLSPVVIQQLLAAHDPVQPRILVPVQEGRRGHPVLFPWPLAAEVSKLHATEGVNSLLEKHGWKPVTVLDHSIFGDLDTPDDYEQMKQ